jgi:hypothetical protein
VIIQQFQKWKGIAYTPNKIHSAIRWNQSDPMSMIVLEQISSWQIIQTSKEKKQANKTPKSNLVNFVAAQGSIPINTNSQSIQNNKKRKTILEVTIYYNPKKRKLDHNISDTKIQSKIQINNKKHNLDSSEIFESPIPRKKLKLNNAFNIPTKPNGLIWDAVNYSCAYDALFTILLSIWSENPQNWNRYFQNINEMLKVLTTGFYKANE